MRFLHAFLVSSALVALSGCTVESRGDEDIAGTSDELSSLPTGTFTIATVPASGSYVARLSLLPGKKFEMEYVRRTTTSKPWLFNPWILVPSTEEDAVVVRGTYFLFDGGDLGETISLDVGDGLSADDFYLFGVATEPGGVKLTTVADGSTFHLRRTTGAPAPTDKRVLRCDGKTIEAVITLDEAQRRRGTLEIVRKPGTAELSPPEGTTTVVYVGRTGVDDYMAYEGRDSVGNGYDFAVRRSDLDKTSGPTANVGLRYQPKSAFHSAFYHNTLTCTIALR